MVKTTHTHTHAELAVYSHRSSCWTLMPVSLSPSYIPLSASQTSQLKILKHLTLTEPQSSLKRRWRWTIYQALCEKHNNGVICFQRPPVANKPHFRLYHIFHELKSDCSISVVYVEMEHSLKIRGISGFLISFFNISIFKWYVETVKAN